jgi:hypothetical protein
MSFMDVRRRRLRMNSPFPGSRCLVQPAGRGTPDLFQRRLCGQTGGTIPPPNSGIDGPVTPTIRARISATPANALDLDVRAG